MAAPAPLSFPILDMPPPTILDLFPEDQPPPVHDKRLCTDDDTLDRSTAREKKRERRVIEEARQASIASEQIQLERQRQQAIGAPTYRVSTYGGSHDDKEPPSSTPGSTPINPTITG